MPETFTPKTWADFPAGGTPVLASDLNRLEQGVESMDDRVAALESGGAAAGGKPDDSYLAITESPFNAVGDYIPTAGTGTDNAAAIQACIEAATAAKKKVWIPDGRFAYDTTLNIDTGNQGTVIEGSKRHLRTAGVNTDGGTCSLEFRGGNATHGIEVIGTTETSVSKVAFSGFTLIDRRTQANVTAGDGIHILKAVNNVTVANMDIFGFWQGSKVRVTAMSGSSSDCVRIEDIWCIGEGLYGINVDSVDNYCLIRQIMHDTPNGGMDLAMIRVDTGTTCAIIIEGIKHENQNPATPTILVNATPRYCIIQGVAQRGATFQGGPVVQIDNSVGSEVLILGASRSADGTLVETTDVAQQPKVVTGTRLPFWIGGVDGLYINEAKLSGATDAGREDTLIAPLGTRVVFADLVSGVSDGSTKVGMAPDTNAQKALTIRGKTGQSVDLVRIHDVTGSGGTCWRIASDASIVHNAKTSLGAAVVMSKETTVADTTYTILATDYFVAVTSLSAPRTLTLPSASTVGNGFLLVVKDRSGAAATHNITVARSGAQTIDGATSVVIAANYGIVRLRSNGTNWDII